MKKKHTGNTALFIVAAVIYVGLLILFGWQTWQFIVWLFPADQWLMQVLTELCFDVMAAVWALIDLFYHHATRGTRSLVQWGWGISFLLSFVASILYLVLQAFTRFNMMPTPAMIDFGYGVSIIALTVTVLLITFWLYQEWSVRHPHTDDYAYDVPDAPQSAPRIAHTAQARTPVELQEPHTDHLPITQKGGASGSPLA